MEIRTHVPVQLDLVHGVLQLRLGVNAPHVRVVARGPQLVDLLLLDVQVGERLVQLVSRLALLGDRAVRLGLDLGHLLVEFVVLLLEKGELLVALLQVVFRATEAGTYKTRRSAYEWHKNLKDNQCYNYAYEKIRKEKEIVEYSGNQGSNHNGQTLTSSSQKYWCYTFKCKRMIGDTEYHFEAPVGMPFRISNPNFP
jgi:hypothetical protein